MNYKQIYDNIIQNRQLNPVEGYTENHHIQPKSLGGSDDKSNLVRLTAREHFICHYLLTKIYVKDSNEWYKMIHAFMMMNISSDNQERYFNSYLYEKCKIKFSRMMSRTQLGKKNSQFGTIWICNLELKQNKKIDKFMEIPFGWVKGRSKWIKLNKNINLNEKRNKLTEKKKNEAIELYKLFLESDLPLTKFVLSEHYNKTRFALMKKWKKHIPNFDKLWIMKTI